MHHEPENPERPPYAGAPPAAGWDRPTEPNPPAWGGAGEGDRPTEPFPPGGGYTAPPPPPPPPTGGPSEPSAYGWGSGPQPPARRGRGKLVALIVAGVVLLGGVAFAGVMLVSSMSASPDVLVKMVPASDQAYVTAYLDPDTNQKLNLRDLLGRFPALQGKDPAKSLDEFLEQALRPSGLSWVGDVKPWVGSQIAVAGKADDSGQPDLAVMIASKDDTKALDTMRRLERLSTNDGLQWRSETYQGIEIRVGERPGAGDGLEGFTPFGSTAAYAIVDHTVVAGTSLDRVKAVIDADQGRGDTLGDDENFQKARSALPDDVLGMAYVNVGDLLDKTLPQLEAGLGFSDLPPGCSSDELNRSLDAARAFRGLALSVTAESDGLALDMGLAVDRSKLPSGQSAIVDADAHQNLALSFTPKDALGTFVFTGANALQGSLDQFEKCQPDLRTQLDKYGVKDILGNLSGDIGVEVHRVGQGGAPSAALVAAVKDEGKMQDSLDRLAAQLIQDSGASAKPTSEDYQGVTIKSVVDPNSPEVAPSWAVTDGVAILATSADEVKAAIDAHAGDDVTADATFQQAAARVELDNQSMLYVNVQSVLDAVQARIPPEGLEGFTNAIENVRPLKATVLTSTTDGDVVKVRWFFLVP
jgi:hypothetical protein